MKATINLSPEDIFEAITAYVKSKGHHPIKKTVKFQIKEVCYDQRDQNMVHVLTGASIECHAQSPAGESAQER